MDEENREASNQDESVEAPSEGEEIKGDSQTKKTIGEKDGFIRVLNFAGGGFDTVMQLGVVHALLVIQGRAPDAIVGMSVGAINAVAAADVMQAGAEFDVEPMLKEAEDRDEKPDSEEVTSLHQRRRAARVARFREMVKAAQKAPEAIVDTLLPDAYQIESQNPLQSLRTPRFSGWERDARDEKRRAQSGLIELYNDILGVNVNFGVVTRIIRRILGFNAAGAISDPLRRFAAQFLELHRIWLLVGLNMLRMVTLLPILFNPLSHFLFEHKLTRFLSKSQVAPVSGLIFRSPAIKWIRDKLLYIFGLILLSSCWITIYGFLSGAIFVFFLPRIIPEDKSLLLLLLIGLSIPLSYGLIKIAFSFFSSCTDSKSVHLNKIILYSFFIFFPWALTFVSYFRLADLSSPSIFMIVLVLLVVFALVPGLANRRHDTATLSIAVKEAFKELTLTLVALCVLSLPLWTVGVLYFDAAFWPSAGVTREHGIIASVYPILTVLVIVTFLLTFFFTRKKTRGATNIRMKETFFQWYRRAFLKSYNLSAALLHHYGLEKFLSDLFDPDYYKRKSWDSIIEESLHEAKQETPEPPDPSELLCNTGKAKTVGAYSEAHPPIFLGLAVADVSKIGPDAIDVIDEEVPVVGGLRAANAWVPLFSPVRYDTKLYVDSKNVCPVPMPALLRLLGRPNIKVHEDAKAIHVYRVSPVPFSTPHLYKLPRDKPLLNLIDITLRALKLQKLRDANLEFQLTTRYTKFISGEGFSQDVEVDDQSHKRFRIWVAPIELDIPSALNTKILFANRDERRKEILTTIARGCRASLEVMIADAINETRGDVLPAESVPCAAAVRHHLRTIKKENMALFGELPLPGSAAAAGISSTNRGAPPPGLAEICEYCVRNPKPNELPDEVEKQVLVWRQWDNTAPSWPHEFDDDTDEIGEKTQKHFEPKPPARSSKSTHAETTEALRSAGWPKNTVKDGEPVSTDSRALVSVAFSGGVFKGVFQVGVVNALHMLGIKPDIVAGASIGSITSAMAGEVLCPRKDEEGHKKKEYAQRREEKLALLVATYLSIDRIILTDQFADFVREFTVRASATSFSLRQADQLFRQYDHPRLKDMDSSARQVIAGVERLFYVSPYQLNRLVKSTRHHQTKLAGRLARELLQQWLNRMNTGEEALGAEALSQLIEYFLGLDSKTLEVGKENKRLQPAFSHFLDRGALLLATSTNLTSGELVTLGNPYHADEQPTSIDLTQALLASSAFPSIFRPRWAQEVFPNTSKIQQLIDGGVMDNLPIEPVLDLLWSVSSTLRNTDKKTKAEPLIVPRPKAANGTEIPHLVFAASLQPMKEPLEVSKSVQNNEMSDDQRTTCRSNMSDDQERLIDYWPALAGRAQALAYNYKLDVFRNAAREISYLGECKEKSTKYANDLPLNLEICALKPRWLCGAYAFHPMLGFSRKKQAQSIAHGCAMTLLKFADYSAVGRDDWLEAWGVYPSNARQSEPRLLDHLKDTIMTVTGDRGKATELGESAMTAHVLEKSLSDWEELKHGRGGDECWLLRNSQRCPFSKGELSSKDFGFSEETLQELAAIHICCASRQTHGIS